MEKKVAVTTLATGKNRSVRRASGFTLIEILIVLALIAVASSLLIVNFSAMVANTEEPPSADESLIAATRAARFMAARTRSTTRMYYDAETGSLEIYNGTGDSESFPLGAPFGSDAGAEVRFYLVPASEGLSPPQDPDNTNQETTEIQFAPDRSSSPFVVELDDGNASPLRMVFDPFSNLIKIPK